MIEFIYKEPTLREVINIMKRLNQKGYDVWLEGRGDMSVRLMIEDFKYTIMEVKN